MAAARALLDHQLAAPPPPSTAPTPRRARERLVHSVAVTTSGLTGAPPRGSRCRWRQPAARAARQRQVAVGHLRLAGLAAQLPHASISRKIPRIPGWHDDRPPPSVLSGRSPPRRRWPSARTCRPRPWGRTRVLEQQQHGDREAVVELDHVDVVGRHARRGRVPRGRPRARRASCSPASG